MTVSSTKAIAESHIHAKLPLNYSRYVTVRNVQKAFNNNGLTA